MLKCLQNRLCIFLIIISMTLITLILCFSFWNTWQAQQNADIIYIQRMASLIIYQLEADPAEPEEILSNYEKEMNVYSILKDNTGHIVFQSTPDTSTDFETLKKIAEENIEIQSKLSHINLSPITEQGGYWKILGNSHDRYYVIPASVNTKSGNWYSLVLFYKQSSIGVLLLRQAPAYCALWLLTFICILFASRLLLRQAFKPTEQVFQSQKDFVAAASHELKSPLAVIMANVESIHNIEILGQQAQNNLKVIDSECIRMSRLVRDMLFLASSDVDKWSVQTQKVNIDTLLITLYDAYEPICKSKRIFLELDLDNDSYPQIQTDYERLFQVLCVFLDNAISYSPEYSHILIHTKQTPRELTFFVIDHGTGIAEKDKPYIFNRFYRADKSRTIKSHFGLGLSIAKELAKMLNGKIGFQDTPGGGATFFLSLPVK